MQNPVQTITVFSGCITDTWYGIDGNPWAAGLVIEPIDTNAANTLFVKGTGGALSITGSDANTGISLGSPLASLNAAIAKCTGGSPYTIYVDGTVTEPDPLSQFRIYKQVTVKSLSERATIKKADDFTKSLIIIDSRGSLTLENIILDGAGIGYTGIGGLVYNEGTLTLKDGTVLQNGKADNGGAVYSKGDFNINGNAIVTPSDDNAKGKNDVYLATNTSGSAKIMLNGALTGTGTVVRITPETYATTTQVLTGSVVAAQYTKFAVTPNGSEVWKVNDQGKLFLHEATVTGTDTSTDAWKKLKEAVTNVADGGTITINGKIKATSDTDNFGEILINKNLTIQGATGAATDILNANSNHTGTPPGDAPTTPHRIFKVESNKTLTLKKLTLKNGYADNGLAGELGTKGGGIYAAAGTTVNIDIQTTIQNCKATDGGVIYNDGGNLTIKGASVIKGNEATNNGGAFLIKGGSLHMENNCIIEKNKAKNGGGIYITNSGTAKILFCRASQNEAQNDGGSVYVDNGTFTIGGTTVFTLSTEAEENRKGKNDVYLKNGRKITVDGQLNPLGGIAARITPEDYNTTTQVLTGSAVATQYTKFAVTPKETGGKTLYWEVDADGKLMRVVDGTKPNAWKVLKDTVEAAVSDEIITIKGEIKATNASGNSGEIVINKNLTIKGKTGAATDILNANKDTGGKQKHRIFKVIRTGSTSPTLTLENLTLKGGEADGTQDADKCGGAIYAKGATVKITNCTLTGNKVKKYGGAIYAEKDDSTASIVTITGGAIGGTNAEEANQAASSGGGIYVGESCSLTLKDSTGAGAQRIRIIGNKALGGSGGAILASGATVNITNCTLAGNTAKGRGGAVSAFKENNTAAKVTISGGLIGSAGPEEEGNKTTDVNSGGGGICIDSSELILKDGARIIGNKADHGGGMRTNNATVTITGCTIASNTAYDYGGGIDSEKGSVAIIGGTIERNTADRFGGGIYIGKDCTVELQNNASGNGVSLIGNTAAKGGGVFIEKDNTIFTINGSSCVTPSAGEDANKAGKNDVYLDDIGSSSGTSISRITVTGSLTPPDGIVARITVADYKYQPTTQVLTGSVVAAQYTKFAVTPKETGGKTLYWEVDADGKLIRVVDGAKPNAWKVLKDTVEAAVSDEIIPIKGEIKATSDTDNFGEILINKNLTIKGADKNNDKLDAHTLHRIFKVTGNGVTLTVKNLTLTGGKASDTATSEEEKNGGGVYVDSGANLTMTASLIQGCTAGKDGGGIYTKGSMVTMTDSDIKKCEAKSGGAICAFSNESPAPSVHITNGTIGGTDEEANKATGTNIDSGKGGGIFIQGNDSTLMLEGSATLTGNTAEKFGGGVYFDGGTFTMKGSSRITPDANKNDVYLDNLKMITLPDPLIGAAPVARITPALYGADKKVLTGSAVSTNYTKFTVTPEELSSGNTQDWEIKNDGMLHK